MKKKINLRLIGISIVAVIATMFCVTFVFYGLFQKQVRSDLRTNAEILKMTGLFEEDGKDTDNEDMSSGEESKNDTDSSEMLETLEERLSDLDTLRITWVASDGTVLYDNDASADELENHLSRPEIADALENGEGEITRKSDTMDMNTMYYAVLLDDGSVLRLSADVRSIFSVFVTAFPVILLIVIVIIVLCALMAHVLTRKILAPIAQLAEHIEDSSHTPVYKELIPFVNTIRRQHENILSAARSRQDFTANVSHELKTPLTAISGYAELIENHMVSEEQETRFAAQIRQNADRLVSLINDIIRLSELDVGDDTQITFEQLDLYEAAKERLDLLSVNAEKRNIRLSLTGESCTIRANRNMMTELIDNLCQNAIRYNNPGGRVTVTVRPEANGAVLTVADTGIGIPRDLQERVFERFYRVDKSRSKETGGTGLGLAIVKHIVELHDAEITLDSEVGKGTMITVRF